MVFDLAVTLRRLKPEKRTLSLIRRVDHELPFVGQHQAAGLPLLLDTTVYIDVLQGRSSPELNTLLRVRQVNHSSIALSELAHLFGRLDPVHPDSRTVLAEIKTTIDDIPQHRLSAPSVQAMAEAGIVTGLVARLKGLPKIDRQPLFNDACMFLQALESGSILVSRNIADMDLIDQLLLGGRILLYNRIP